MRLPNGFGSIYRLPGKRRRPFVVKKSIGGKQIPLGYFETYALAMNFLVAYNHRPVSANQATFSEIYALWKTKHFPQLRSESARVAYANSYRHCQRLHNMIFSDIRLHNLDEVIDDVRQQDCGHPTQKKVKSLLTQLYKYAARYDITAHDYARYLDIDRPKPKYKKQPFTVRQINKLWRGIDECPEARIILMLIYSGCRVGEFIHVKKSDVKLRRRVFRVTESKTDAGRNRLIPIPKQLLPWYEEFMHTDGEYLIGEYTYDRFRRVVFDKVMKHFHMHHTPHETRHTCASMLDSADINRTVIKLILGHTLEGVTEKVYTHKTVRELLRAIDKICN